MVIDLEQTIPTQLSEALRQAGHWAERRAADPLNAFDDNPRVGAEWEAVAIELEQCADRLDKHLEIVLKTGGVIREPPQSNYP